MSSRFLFVDNITEPSKATKQEMNPSPTDKGSTIDDPQKHDSQGNELSPITSLVTRVEEGTPQILRFKPA